MALLEEWHKIAYNDKADQGELQRFWQHYFLLEKGVYEKLLANPDIDYAIQKIGAVNSFLCQGTDEKFSFEEELELLEKVFE